MIPTHDIFAPLDTMLHRHLGPRAGNLAAMLEELNQPSLDELTDAAIPSSIRTKAPFDLPAPQSQSEALAELKEIAEKNKTARSFIGMGYYGTLTPPVLLRNILENPGWYTQYTPYQAEISQGRLEALLNFQTMVADLTGLPSANASVLDEATAAAEAMVMAYNQSRGRKKRFLADEACHPQTIAVVQTRAAALGVKVEVIDILGGSSNSSRPSHQPHPSYRTDKIDWTDCFGVLMQYPDTRGRIRDWGAITTAAHAVGAMAIVATDLMALALIKTPSSFGADVAVGSAQRFGLPMGYGGPHAGFMSAREELLRKLPGRIAGVSVDSAGRPALRLSLQAREQHIRREKASSNICTAQALPAIMASMYAVYHGPEGLTRIARRIHRFAGVFANSLRAINYQLENRDPFFDTVNVVVDGEQRERVLEACALRGVNLRMDRRGALGVAFDETVTRRDLEVLVDCFMDPESTRPNLDALAASAGDVIPGSFSRTSTFLTHPVFNSYRCEHEVLRYLNRLQSRDLSLTTSMIPLGSCTMKLNATSQMMPITWPQFAALHPFAPSGQTAGYAELFTQLEAWLADITGFAAVSLQPNAGSQGEYTGLMTIRAFHAAHDAAHRDVCLVPVSAHGTNPASAVMAGMKVVAVACLENGDFDLDDLRAKAGANAERLAAVMITYPSTHGVFEEGVRQACDIVHEFGGQVYLDGANMNAMAGLVRPGEIGADVCHLNLHKSFCIPHGGGGPGMGPVCSAVHLAPFLPGHPVVQCGGGQAIGPVAAAPWGSASILPIVWMYIRTMGEHGLRRASQTAVLNANYMARRLRDHYPLRYTGANGLVAHEFIIDLNPFKKSAGIVADDVAKRLMDFGFHAPTMSWPEPGMLMIEPTESESRAELDRYCEALIAIRAEIREIEEGRASRENNPLKGAPHTAQAVTAEKWDRPYSREDAAWPAPWTLEHKFWPPVGRVDNVHGDRNPVCLCPPVADYAAV